MQLGYQPNESYRDASAITIEGKGRSVITVEAQAVGTRFQGLIAFAVAFWRVGRHVDRVSPEIFQVSYAESLPDAEMRFERWLERSITEAINRWRQTL